MDERTGRRCHPGQDYQCRCFARPVFNQTTLNLPIAGEDGGDHLSTVNGVRAGTESKDRFGIISNNNRGDPRYYDFVGKNMQLVESELSQRNFETAVCFDENGKAIFAQLGNEDSIRFTKIQQKRMKGKILTHNHPLGTPPSPEDLYVLKENRLKEFRTCGRNSTYVLRYSKEVEELPELSVLGDKYNIILDRLRPEYISKVEYGFDDRTALILLGEEIWKELGEEYGVILEYEKR